MIRSMKTIAIFGSIAVLLLIVACASSLGQFTDSAGDESTRFLRSAEFAPPAAPAPPPEPSVTVANSGGFDFDVAVEEQAKVSGSSGPPGAPGLPGNPGAGSGQFAESDSSTEQQVALVAQQRIIVRTVDMQLVVTDVSKSVDDIADLADDFGGWVINSDRSYSFLICSLCFLFNC